MKISFTFLKIFFPTFLCLLMTAASCFATEDAATGTTPVSYPLSTCVVSGDKLGVMGAPVIVQHDGTEVRFCCKDCVKDFDKDPEKYLKRLHAAPQQ